MMKGLIFFCCSCAILLFSIINLSIGPIVNKVVNNRLIFFGSVSTQGNDWGTLNCAILSDYYDEYKKTNQLTKEAKKYSYEWYIDECNRKKGMHDMEYTSFIFDIVIGFICSLLGLLHHLEVKKDFVSKTGLIGLICGIVGFAMTFTYLILNGIVYTSYYDRQIYKVDEDGAFAKLVSTNKYECLYYDDHQLNVHSYFAKYSDLIKKQYNYNKDLEESIDSNCKRAPSLCKGHDYYSVTSTISDSNGNECKYLYTNNLESGVENKDKSDRFLTTLLLSLFACLANIGLAIFGFLLFRTPGEF